MLGATQMRCDKKYENKNKLKNICRMDYPKNKAADSPTFLQYFCKGLKTHFK
jgi:hypothetical protein